MISLVDLATTISRISAQGIDWTLKALASNQNVNNLLKKLEAKRLRQLDNLKRILIIADINIGDAVNTQAFLGVFRHFFPYLEISYAYQYKAYPLIKANPKIDKHFPLFRSFGYPSKVDNNNLKKLIKNNDFDLIINFCPFFSSKDLKSVNSSVISPIRFMANIIRAYASGNPKAHIAFQFNKFAHELVENFASDNKPKSKSSVPFSGNYLYTTQQLYTKTRKVMHALKINPQEKKIFFNPDTASPYTRIPFQFQLELLKGILSNKNLDLLILDSGYNFKEIERELINEIPFHLSKKIVVIPRSIPIDVCAGLMDNSEMLISGDTAPLHIAAAKKIIVNSDNRFKNSTAIVGIFGATSPRIYGYDSFSDKYLPATQDAPSKTFEGSPPCKNLTCLHKLSKRCPEVRCFHGLMSEQVIDYINNYLS